MRERERSGVKIDFCASCKGVWLDRGELDKIIAIELGDDDDDDGRRIEARNVENARDARRRDDDDDDDRRRGDYGKSGDYDEYGRKKKSKKSSFFGSLTEMLGGEE